MQIKHSKSWLKLSVMALALAGVTQAQAVVRTNYLANARPLIKFNELSRAEKQVLAEQTQIVLRDLYVNRYQKVEYYGSSPYFNGHVDPASKVTQVISKLDSLSTTELHQQLSQIFVNQRDLHLNYNLPLPHAAFLSFIPVNFSRTVGENNQEEVRLSTVYGAFFDALIRDQRKPQLGDEVLEYDGLPIQTAITNALYQGNGANPYAGASRALQFLTFVPQSVYLPPAKDKVTLKLRSAANGEVYTITVPWLVQYDDAKLNPVPAPAPASSKMRAAPQSLADMTLMSNEPIQELFNQFQQRNLEQDVAAIPKQSTAEPSIKWAVVDRNGKKVGYLSISSFVPSAVNDNGALAIIANLLRNELATTDALVIDVRNNGGGSIVYADKLPQMFIPGNAKTNAARFLNTKANFDFLNQDIFKFYWPNWVDLITKAQQGKGRYSATGVFTTPADANTMGQMYYKPVGVLMNARSFSATDLFTCAMTDNAAATIFGEDKRTGSGGANVLEYGFFNTYQPAVFKPLPGGVSMRVSWRQSVRNNYNHDLIEDYGCSSQVDVPRVAGDLSSGDQLQFNKVADSLLARSPSKSTYRFTTAIGNVIAQSPAARSLSIEVTNTEHLKIYVNNVLLKSQYVGVYGNPRVVTVNLPEKNPGETYQLALVGTDAGQTPLWNTKRMVQVAK